MAEKTMVEAIRDALAVELEHDENMLIFGEDIGKNGGVFRATEGLQEAFGEDRVFDTPLAESGIMGLALGLGLQGFRPVPELQFFGFVLEAMDAIVGQMSRIRYRTDGKRHMPVTIRAPFGGGVGTPELHSDSLEGMLGQAPGLRIVIPSNPYDAKGLLISSIRSNDPVLFLEHLKLYRSVRQDVPEGAYTVPLDKAAVVTEGSDVTILAYGAMVQESVKAAELLQADGISAEVIDLRTVSPVDLETIAQSVKKTGRVVAVQEAQRQAGVMGGVLSEIAERLFLYLEAPVARVTAPDTIFPYGQAEGIWIPNGKEIAAKAKEIVSF